MGVLGCRAMSPCLVPGRGQVKVRGRTMKTGWLGWLAVVVLAGLAVYALYPAGQPVVQGIARGEPTSGLRPLSYWLEVLNQPVNDATTHEKERAVEALGKMGPGAIKPLVEAAENHKYITARMYIPRAVAAIGEPAVQPLLEVARTDPQSKDIARNALAAIGRPAVQPLAGMLKDPDPEVRVWAALVLGDMGPGAEDAVPALIEALKDKRDPWREQVVRGRRNDRSVRGSYVQTLGKIGPGARAAVPILMETLSDQHIIIHPSAIQALGSIGPAAADAVPLLIKELQNNGGGPVIRRDAALAIGRIGLPAAKQAVPELVRLTKDPDPQVSEIAKDVLAKIDPAAAAERGIK